MRKIIKRVWTWIKTKLGKKSEPTQQSVVGFTNISFPIVRRVYPQLIASQLVSIQPMSMPAGGIFTLPYTYDSSKLPVMYFYRRAVKDSDADLGHVIAYCGEYSMLDHNVDGRWTFSSMRVKR